MAHSVKHYFNLFVNKDASMKVSCVINPDCEPMIIARKWQLDFCNGNKSAAALLSFFEYWHNMKLEQSHKAKFPNNIAKANSKVKRNRFFDSKTEPQKKNLFVNKFS